MVEFFAFALLHSLDLSEGPDMKMLHTHLTLDQFLGNFDGSLTEGTAILGTDLSTHCKIGRLITVGLEQ